MHFEEYREEYNLYLKNIYVNIVTYDYCNYNITGFIENFLIVFIAISNWWYITALINSVFVCMCYCSTCCVQYALPIMLLKLTVMLWGISSNFILLCSKKGRFIAV